MSELEDALTQVLELEKQVKRLREDNHDLRMVDWEYERVWEWLSENADHTCRKLLLLIEEWKEEEGLVTIDSRTFVQDDNRWRGIE